MTRSFTQSARSSRSIIPPQPHNDVGAPSGAVLRCSKQLSTLGTQNFNGVNPVVQRPPFVL